MVEQAVDYQRYSQIPPEIIESSGLASLCSQDLIPASVPHEKLLELVRGNFGMDRDTFFKDKDGDAAHRQMFMASVGERSIGLLSFLELGLDAVDNRSSVSWKFIQDNAPEFYEKVESRPGPILWSNGLVVDREWRRSGVYRSLMSQAIETLNPALIVSTSKHPVSVEARAAIVGEKGYRTFFGYDEITPGTILEERPTKLLATLRGVDIWLYSGDLCKNKKGEPNYNSLVVRFSNLDVNDREIPDVSHSNEKIKNAFQLVIDAQRRVNSSHRRQSISDTLISVRGDLL